MSRRQRRNHAALADISMSLLGARSESSFVQAVIQAENGQPVLTDDMRAEESTCDIAKLRELYDANPFARFHLRTLPEDGLVAIRFTDALAVQTLEKHFDTKLPRTLTVESADSELLFCIFLRPVAAPPFDMNANVAHGVDAQIASSVPLPNGTYRWKQQSAPGELCAAFLPRPLVLGLPKRRGASSLFVKRPDEYHSPHIPRWVG